MIDASRFYPPQPGTVFLVGCAAMKSSKPCKAKDMYCSPIFQARRSYCEAIGGTWFIVSALHGLLDPEQVIEHYDLCLDDLSEKDQAVWGMRVCADLLAKLQGDIRHFCVEVHAGGLYAETIKNFLAMAGVRAIATPYSGLGIGEAKALTAELLRRATFDRKEVA